MAAPRNPELQKLLAALNGTSPDVNTVDRQYYHATAAQDQSTYVHESQDPHQGLKRHFQAVSEAQNTEHQLPSNQSLRIDRPPSDLSRSSTPVSRNVPDPSTIIAWPAALKYITKHIASDDKAAAKIKHLISEQHKHERLWWTQREAIVTRQQGREGNQAKAAELLKSLGVASTVVPKGNPDDDLAELAAFDQKVYKSLTHMVVDFDGQLRKLGIPFFSIKQDLICSESETARDRISKGKIDRGGLKELQRRMIQTLEDLFGEES